MSASLLYQTGFSGRAEIGLAGSDDLALKVSPDGSAWLDALVVNRTTGKVTGEAVQSGATDVTAGRLLRVGAFGLGSDAGPNVADLDTHELSGFFFGYGGASVTPPTGDNPFPTLNGAYGLICGNGVLGDASSYLWQIALQYGTLSPKLKFRNKAGTTWDAWQTVIATDNILGPVSQVGGVPTGAIFERGSNANGDYVRFADGTQICTRQGLVATFVDADLCAATWTCPAAFAVPPAAVTPTLDGGAWGASGPASGVGRGDVQPVSGANTASSVSAQVWASGSATFVSGYTVPLMAAAFGRWFQGGVSMNIKLVPQRRDTPLVAKKSGDVLVLNGEAFDFSPLQEGDVLPPDAIASDLFAGPVSRLGGALHLALVLPIGANAPEDAQYPLPLEYFPDGIIPLPGFEDVEHAVEGTL